MSEPGPNDSAAGSAGDDQSMRALAQQIIAGDGLPTSPTSSGLSPGATFGLWLIVASPIVLVLVLAGNTSGTLTAVLSATAAVSLVATIALASHHKFRVACLVLDGVYLLATMLVLAQPGGRHPILMGVAAFIGGALALQALWKTTRHLVTFAVVLPAAVDVWAVGSSSLPLKAKLAAYSHSMNEQAQQVLDHVDRVEPSPVETGECPYLGGPLQGPLGPFPYCGSEARYDDSTVSYSVTNTALVHDSHSNVQLIYSPAGEPSLMAGSCVAHVYGSWYEYYSYMSGTFPCPAGLEPVS